MEEKLIEFVKENPILFDLTNRGYRNLLIKNEIWKEIAGKLNTNAETCKKKWKSLRDQYRCNKQKKVMPSGSGAGAGATWRYFESLTFLDKYDISRTTIESVDLTDIQAYSFDGMSNSLDDADMSCSLDEPNEPKIKRKKKNVNDEMVEFLDSASKAIDEVSKNEKENVSSTQKFMFSVAAQIDEANMPIKAKLDLQNIISDLVFTELISWQK